MNAMRRWVVIVALAVVGCSTTEHDEGRVVVWHAYRGQEEQALRSVARAFERAHPSIDVVLLAQPYGAYASKLESAIPTGNGPDLFIDAHERLPSYREGGLVAPFEPSDRETIDRRLEGADVAALTDRSVIYGLPIALKCAALYINDALVPDDPPTLEAIERLSLRPGLFPLVMEAETPYWAAALTHAYGAQLLDDHGAWGLTGDRAERAVAHLERLVERGVVPQEASGELIPRLFADGRAATAISGPWMAPDLPPSLRWRVRPLPRVEGADGAPMRPFKTVEAIFVAQRARAPQSARRFAEFVTFGEGARIRAREGRQVVTDREAWEAPDLAGDPFLSQFRAAARDAVPLPTHPSMRAVWVPAQRALRNVLRGTSPSISAALAEGRRRFESEAPLSPPRSEPLFGLLVLGGLLLFATIVSVQRLRDAQTRAAIRRSLPAYGYVIHAAVAVGLLVILPLIVAAATSLFAGNSLDSMVYVGAANYRAILTARGGDLFGNGSFYLVLLVTVLWTVVNVALHVAIGVGLALLLHRPYLRLKGVYRVLLILPWAVPNYVTALAWKGLFHRQFGAINAILEALGAEPVSWFSRWSTAFAANVATNVWLGFPFMMVVTLGALTAIPREIYEAAAVDGATRWQRFRLITLPLLRPFLAPAVAMGAVWTFNMFNVVFLVSGGEPDGSTEILVSEAYRWAFTRGHQYGYAAAYAVLIFVILVVSTRAIGAKAAR